jgi:hypothetical protein
MERDRPEGRRRGYESDHSRDGRCVLHEHWVGSKGGNGESFNIYDGATKQWHQTWVDNSGTLLALNGGLVGGAWSSPAREGTEG